MTVSAGIFFYSKNSNRYLYLLRSVEKNLNHWGIPGGKVEKGETLFDGLKRECIEEINYWPSTPKLVPIQKFTNHNFVYHTFFCELETEFIPILNDEHNGYAWINENYYPKPLHPGLFNTINFDVVQNKLKLLTKTAD